jgi:hypothetical protein
MRKRRQGGYLPTFIYDATKRGSSGVYKLVLSTGYFYIGSTKHFGKRIGCFKAAIGGRK